MSLGIVVEGPEGIVLAAESRVTLTAQTPTGPLYVNFDNATKVLAFHNSSQYYFSIAPYIICAYDESCPSKFPL